MQERLIVLAGRIQVLNQSNQASMIEVSQLGLDMIPGRP
jgi:hypothetical protein